MGNLLEKVNEELRANAVLEQIMRISGRFDRMVAEVTWRGQECRAHVVLRTDTNFVKAEMCVDCETAGALDFFSGSTLVCTMLTALANKIGMLSDEEEFALSNGLEEENVWRLIRTKKLDLPDDIAMVDESFFAGIQENEVISFLEPKDTEGWLEVLRRAGRNIFGVE